jgi:hypothetical protein
VGNNELGSVTRLQKNRLSMRIEELLLSFRDRRLATNANRGHQAHCGFLWMLYSRPTGVSFGRKGHS